MLSAVAIFMWYSAVMVIYSNEELVMDKTGGHLSSAEMVN